MTKEGEPRGSTTAQLRNKIDRGGTGSKVPFPDPASSPLGTDDEAAGTPPSADVVEEVMRREQANPAAHSPNGNDAHAAAGVRWRNAQAQPGPRNSFAPYWKLAAGIAAAAFLLLAIVIGMRP